jgi:hypothetical protein
MYLMVLNLGKILSANCPRDEIIETTFKNMLRVLDE